MDAKPAFLNGDIDKEIYMEQPIDYVASGSKHKVCKPQRSIYRLR